jgi:NADPH2:quinone reductase
MMRAVVVREYGKAPVVSEIAGPEGESGEVLGTSLNPADVVLAKGLIPFRRPKPPVVVGFDGVARRPDGSVVHFWMPPAPYGSFAERVPLAGVTTVPLPAGLDPGLGAAVLSSSGLAAWTGLAVTGGLQPGESVLVLGANGQVGRVAVQAARLLGARRVAGVVYSEADAKVPLQLGADAVETSLDSATLAGRLLAGDKQGYDVILDTLWGPVVGPALGAAARGARLVHIGNSAGADATITATAIRNNGVRVLPHVNPAVPERARSEAFARLAEHAAAGELTVEYTETSLEGVPDVWDDFASGKVTAKIIVRPLGGTALPQDPGHSVFRKVPNPWAVRTRIAPRPARGVRKISLSDTPQKTKNLRRDPNTTLFIIEPGNPGRTLEIPGRAELAPDSDFASAAKAGAKYSLDFRVHDWAGETRSIVTLHPVRVVATDIGRSR